MWLSGLLQRFTHLFEAFLILIELTIVVKRGSILLAVDWLVRLPSCEVRLVGTFFLALQ
jgi:hypothetical protein